LRGHGRRENSKKTVLEGEKDEALKEQSTTTQRRRGADFVNQKRKRSKGSKKRERVGKKGETESQRHV